MWLALWGKTNRLKNIYSFTESQKTFISAIGAQIGCSLLPWFLCVGGPTRGKTDDTHKAVGNCSK